MAIDLTVVIDEKKAVNQFRRLRKEAADAVSGMSKEFDKMDSAVDDFAENIALSKKYIEELKRKYQEVSAALGKAPLGSKERAVLGMELRNINNELKAEEKAIRDAEIALKSQERAYASLESEMKDVKNEMAQLDMSGQRNSTRYKELEDRLGQLATAHKRVQLEQKKLSTSATQWAGIQSGLQGVLGAFAVGQGIIGAFASDTEKLVKIQTRLQSIMGIIMGMTQVSKTLHETSEFRTTTLTKVTELWNVANQKVAAGLVKVGVSANAASVAAKALTASMTLGLSVAISAAIVGINKLITKYQDTKKAAEEAAQAQRQSFRDYTASVASNTSKTLVKFNQLKQKYEALGDSLEAKKRFIQDNAEAFKELGVRVIDVNDAENLFINNANAFAASVELKARATAAMEMAAKKYEESMQKMLNAENLDIESRDEKTWWGGTRTTYSAKGLTDEENEKLNDIINAVISKLTVANNQALAAGATFDQVMSHEEIIEAGMKAGKTYIEGIKTGLTAEVTSLEDEASKIIAVATKQTEASKSTLQEAGIIIDTDNGRKDTKDESRSDEKRNKLSALILANQRALVQSRIDIMKEGREKELEEIDLWLEDQVTAIEKARQEILQLQGLGPDDKLDSDTENAFSERKANAEKAAEARRAEANARYDQQEAELYASLLAKYADYDERRREIDERYAEDKKSLEDKYAETGDERYSNALIVLAKKHTQEVNALDMAYDKVYEKIFRDPSKMTKSTILVTLDLAKEKLAELSEMSKDGELIDPESVKALSDAISKLEEAADNMSLDGWSDSYDGIIKKTRTIARIENEIAEARASGNKTAEADASERLKVAKTQLRNNLIGTGVDAFAGSLQQASEAMKSIAEITGDVQLGETAEVLSGIAQNFSAAAQGAASGGWIGAIVGGVTDAIGQAMGAITEAIASGEQAKQAIEDYTQAIKDLSLAVNEKDYESVFGKDEWGLLQERAQKRDETYDAFQNVTEKKWESWKPDLGIFDQLGLYDRLPSVSQNILGITQSALGHGYIRSKGTKKKRVEGTLSELYPELFDENGNLILDEEHIKQAKLALESLDGMNLKEGEEIRERLRQAVKYGEDYLKIQEEIQEQVGSILGDWGDEIGNSIVDQILSGADAMTTFENIAKNSIKSIAQQMAKSMILENYLNKFNDEMSEAIVSGDEEKVLAVIDKIAQGMPGAIDLAATSIEALIEKAKEMGYDLSDLGDTASAQTASAKGFQAMSQDTGDELNGRFTDIQGKVTDIRDYVLLVLQRNDMTLNETVNIRDIMIQMNGNVADIRTYTSVLPDMLDTMTRMNRKLDEL